MSYSRSPRRSPRRGYGRRSPPRYRNRSRDNHDRRDRRGGGGRDRYDRRDDRGYGRRDNGGYNRRRGRNRSRSASKDPLHTPLEAFRPRDLSRERPTTDVGDEKRIELEEKEVAYVFGRMGTTKDKLARVSGTNIELHGHDLVIQGDADAVTRAKRYVNILLAQRHGDVYVDPADHTDDLTLVDVPTDCKGFVTGRGGATLRQIERECATLMTFCRQKADKSEPLAIFGTRRGRLTAELKVMSVVEGKHPGWFVEEEDEPPKVHISETDSAQGGEWGVDFMRIEKSSLGYALGQGGNTRIKLQIASGCIIQYIGIWAAFGGTRDEQERGKAYLSWLINQRDYDFSVDVDGRDDVTILYVPEPSVGYVTGKKAKTLRNLEQKSGTFCFFDKRKSGRKKEKMLIFAVIPDHRERAVEEVHMIVNFHQKKTGGFSRVSYNYDSEDDDDRGSMSQSRSKSGSRSRSRSYSRSRSRSRSKKKSRSRSGSVKREKK